MYRHFKNQIKKELMNIEVPKFGKYHTKFPSCTDVSNAKVSVRLFTLIRGKESLMSDVLPSPVLPKYLVPIVEFAVPLSIGQIIRIAFHQ